MEVLLFIFILLIFRNLFLAARGLRCCIQAFSTCGKQGLLFFVVCGLLIVVASLAVEHRLQTCRPQQLWHTGLVVATFRVQSAGLSSCGTWAWQLLLSGSRVQAQQLWCAGLSCSVTCGILSDQGLNPCPLHWQVDSYPLYHERSLPLIFKLKFN